MWSNLVVLHSDIDGRHNFEPEGLFGWKTCMRCIYVGDIRIMDPNLLEPHHAYTVHIGYSAYQVLLEVISGIRSRLLGETEVLNQFRESFKNTNLPKNAFGEYLRKLRDELIEDTRKIRSKHLRGLGDQSYGGLAHRFLGDSRHITLLGTGQLAEQILPWLLENGRIVHVVGRNEERLQFLKTRYPVTIEKLGHKIFVEDSLVLSAPISVQGKLEIRKGGAKIVDFREDSAGDQFPNIAKYYSFSEILDTLKENENKNKKLRTTLEIVVSKIVEDREYVSSNNIYCWEDIPCLAPLR